MTAKMDQLLNGVTTILGARKQEPISTDCAAELKFSLQTMEEFDNLDRKIHDDPALRHKLASLFSTSGGSSVNQISYRVVAVIFTDALMLNYTFAGHTGKPSFRDNLFMSLLCEAVKRLPKGSVGNNKEIETAVKYWLKWASCRIMSKEKRIAAAAAMEGHDLN